jgi:hypothetical protein
VAWAFDTRVNRPLRYYYILAPEYMLHIPVDQCTTLVKYICNIPTDIIYIHTYTRNTFFLNSSLFMMTLTRYQDSIAISNLACNIEREWGLVCKDMVHEESDICYSHEGGSRGGPSRIAFIWIKKTSDSVIINKLLFRKKVFRVYVCKRMVNIFLFGNSCYFYCMLKWFILSYFTSVHKWFIEFSC